MPTDNENTHRAIEVVMGGLALAGAAVSAIWYAGRSLGRIDSTVATTHDAVLANAELNTREHCALSAEQVSIRVTIDDHGKLLIRLIDEGAGRERRISKLEEKAK